MLLRFLLYQWCLLLLPLVTTAQKVVVVNIDGTINPATAGFINRGISTAKEERATCLLITLNTPGGLLKSTRVIVADILEAPVPVIVYVSPPGAHAGSAGVFVTMAAHIAAMAPGTNIGAAHPVAMQSGMDTIMNEKSTNDAIAFIRTIAQKRNRNAEWAENAVRKSYSITATEAKEQKVIDIIAPNIQDLLKQVNGRTVEVDGATATLSTANAVVENLQMSFVEKMLNILSDPNLAYILMMLGFYGLLFELYNPGAIFPGIVGVICLVLAFYSFHTLPVNYAGLALIIFGVILFLLEIKVVSHGMLAIGGIVSLLLGSMMLIRRTPDFQFIKISWQVIIPTIVITALFFLFVIGAGLRAQKAKPVTGTEGLIGETGVVLDTLNPGGTVQVHGELWSAETVKGTIEKGQKIRVTGIENLKLKVELLTE
ncbi:MAG: nodulation protein NfeD [Flavisolibacter sp.]|nr:nodulation protein NfeD [Flavisolibacter sp.]MBD0294507.1 nodulation protein NfeD [Flavisolibacter sp.]MBD0352607.1 nodulation protein NfeD [Flavisolibacter sp.]MBD0368569.1 nodulation protein NfeD [Flavisolibacter sp.]